MQTKLILSEKDLKEIITKNFQKEGKVVKNIQFFYTNEYYDRMETMSSPTLRSVEIELETNL